MLQLHVQAGDFTREHHGWPPRPCAGALPRQQGCRLTKNQRIVMSLAIRPLPMAVRGVCVLCKTEQDLSSWDSNLGGRICRDCEPFLEKAETALVAAKYGHPCVKTLFT
jgi:hypothetical protein